MTDADGLYQRAQTRQTPLLAKLADLTDAEWDELAHRMRKHFERALADKQHEVVPSDQLDKLHDAVAAMASVLVLAERDGMWPYYTKIARRAYDAAGGTLR